MKRFLSILIILASIASYSQPITRGPDIGEIYFIGYTVTQGNHGIYRSTDFGENAICVDSTTQNGLSLAAIEADKTPGGLYLATTGQTLYYSQDYGYQSSWIYKNSDIYSRLSSGRFEGEVFNSISSHSNDYGNNFISHSLNGYFGSVKDAEIDISENICYCITEQYGVNDTQYFFISYDNYDNLEIQYKFNFNWYHFIDISRGNNEGEIYLLNKTTEELYLSQDYGANWELKNQFTCPNLPVSGISGGRQNGELYLKVVYIQLMSQRRHVYIYHSLDYGETFTVYHPIAIGPDPIYANFTAEDTLVEPDDIVQFTDLSNDAETWEWDFDNDGTIDSYEQNPTHSYQDTGHYTVKLSITGYGGVIQDYGIRYDYIHVKNLVGVDQQKCNYEIDYYPNPFNDDISIETRQDFKKIEIYDLNGKSHFSKKLFQENKTEIIDLRKLKKGIYILKIRTKGKDITKKIIKI